MVHSHYQIMSYSVSSICQHILGVGGGQIQYVDTADAGKWSGGKGGV